MKVEDRIREARLACWAEVLGGLDILEEGLKRNNVPEVQHLAYLHALNDVRRAIVALKENGRNRAMLKGSWVEQGEEL